MGIYEQIKEIAKSRGYSVNRLEQELGFARSSINKFNKNNPSMNKIQQIADLLNVSVDYLTGYDDDPIDYEKFDEYIPPQFNGDAKKYLAFQKVVDDEASREILEPVENEEPQIHTIAAHFDGNEYTELELDKIKEFAEFVKNNRKK